MRVVVFLRDKLPSINAPTGNPFRADFEKSGSATEAKAENEARLQRGGIHPRSSPALNKVPTVAALQFRDRTAASAGPWLDDVFCTQKCSPRSHSNIF
jgi:hypothetical protein